MFHICLMNIWFLLIHLFIFTFTNYRICRCGAGKEETPGGGNTPGFTLRSEPAIVPDARGFKKLEMPRNHPRIIQSSVDLMQCWRANCDVQIILYDCDFNDPDPEEIARVTDYVVAYSCKGNESLKEEKENYRSIILRYVLGSIVLKYVLCMKIQ